jgi:hypothetical protein
MLCNKLIHSAHHLVLQLCLISTVCCRLAHSPAACE